MNRADGCGASVGWSLLDERDEGAADDGGVGELADGGDVLGVGDAEADGDGQLRVPAQALDELRGIAGQLSAACR